MDKSCRNCGTQFATNRNWQIFCSNKCQEIDNRKSFQSYYPGLSTGTVGAISELIVCVDLLKKGYEVFRAVSQATSCDLAVLKEHKLYRIEVTTGYRSHRTGVLTKPKKIASRYDILAIAIGSDILYEPPLP